jgi:hypothetical protein
MPDLCRNVVEIAGNFRKFAEQKTPLKSFVAADFAVFLYGSPVAWGA